MLFPFDPENISLPLCVTVPGCLSVRLFLSLYVGLCLECKASWSVERPFLLSVDLQTGFRQNREGRATGGAGRPGVAWPAV